MMKYPNYKDYRAMYQKYINRQNLLDMLDLVDGYKDKNFMDICAGDGAASREAIARGAIYSLIVDQEPQMLATDLKEGRDKIGVWDGSIESLLYQKETNFLNTFFDIVFCRQGINYWYLPKHIHQLAKWMKKDSVFIFNTFNTKPSKKPMVKEYEIDNRHMDGPTTFTEISYLVEHDIVHHVQIRKGYPPHLTQFKWISEEQFKQGLVDDFNYEIRRKDNTDIYICKKK